MAGPKPYGKLARPSCNHQRVKTMKVVLTSTFTYHGIFNLLNSSRSRALQLWHINL